MEVCNSVTTITATEIVEFLDIGERAGGAYHPIGFGAQRLRGQIHARAKAALARGIEREYQALFSITSSPACSVLHVLPDEDSPERKGNHMKTLLLVAVLGLMPLAADAQGPRGPQGGGARMGGPQMGGTQAGQPQLDLTRQAVVEGAITQIHLAYGAQYPSIAINATQIKIAPVWYLLDQNFELKEGDAVRVVVAPSTRDSYLYALNITKTANNVRITLRDEQGLPLWAARGSGPGQRLGNGGPPEGELPCGGACMEAGSVTTITGTVDKVTMGAGIRFPVAVIKTADGKLHSVKIGPERVLLANDFEIAAGQALTAKVGVSSCSDELVALELTDAAGVTVVLRDANGLPAWR